MKYDPLSFQVFLWQLKYFLAQYKGVSSSFSTGKPPSKMLWILVVFLFKGSSLSRMTHHLGTIGAWGTGSDDVGLILLYKAPTHQIWNLTSGLVRGYKFPPLNERSTSNAHSLSAWIPLRHPRRLHPPPPEHPPLVPHTSRNSRRADSSTACRTS